MITDFVTFDAIIVCEFNYKMILLGSIANHSFAPSIVVWTKTEMRNWMLLDPLELKF